MSSEDHEQTRRHFDVVAEGLRSEIQQVAEGVAARDEKLECFRMEAAHSVADVDRRLKAVESR